MKKGELSIASAVEKSDSVYKAAISEPARMPSWRK
jgi:hypothetical protein